MFIRLATGLYKNQEHSRIGVRTLLFAIVWEAPSAVHVGLGRKVADLTLQSIAWQQVQ